VNSDDLVRLLCAHYGQSEFDALLAQFLPGLTLETLTAFKLCVDEDKFDNPPQALRTAETAEAVAQAMNSPEACALALWAKSSALYHLYRYQEMLDCCRQAEAIYAALQQPLKVAALQVNRVVALRDMGEHRAALALAEQARAVCESLAHEAEARRYLGLLAMNVGSIHRQLGDMPAALAAYQQGRAIFEALDDRFQMARMDINLANVLEEMARFEQAEALLHNAQATLTQIGKAQEAARAALNLGILAYRRGQYQPALRHLEAAYAVFAAVPVAVDMAEVDLYRALIYGNLNLLQETITLAARAARTFRRETLRWEYALALHTEASGYRRLGERGYAMAARRLAQARRIFGQEGARTRMLLVDLERAGLALARGQVATAQRLLARLRTAFDPADWPAEAARLALLAARCALALPQPDLAQARQHAGRALEIAQARALSEATAAAHACLGQIAESAGEAQTAWREYGEAIRIVELVRAELGMDEARMGFMDDKLAFYTAAVRVSRQAATPAQTLYTLDLACNAPFVHLEQAAQARVASPEAESLRGRLRALRERWHWYSTRDTAAGSWRQVQLLETEIADLARRIRALEAPAANTTADGAVHLADPDAAEAFVASIQARLSPQDLLLHLYALDDTLHAALVTGDRLDFHALGPLAPLRRLLKAWRFYADHAHLARGESPDYGARFYDLCLQPLEAYLQTCARLWVVLPPEWRDMPLAAFYDGKRYLVERCEVQHLSAPGALLDAPPLPGPGPRQAVVIGHSDAGRLPLAVIEAQQVAETLRARWQTTLLLEEEATLERLHAATRACHLVHLATHAVFRPDNPLFSWIRLADARLTVTEFYEMTLPQRPPVVLSACETGRGQARGGGLLGMGRALLAAGAAGVLVNLWRVADEAALRLMADLYAHWDDDVRSPAAALCAAQRQAIARGAHPLDWAGLLFIGG